MTVVKTKKNLRYIYCCAWKKNHVWSTISQYLLVNVGPIERILSILDNDSHNIQPDRPSNGDESRKKNNCANIRRLSRQPPVYRFDILDQKSECCSYTLLYSVNAFFSLFLSFTPVTTAWWIALRLKSVRSFLFLFLTGQTTNEMRGIQI